MYPTFNDGDYALAHRTSNIERGDVIVFWNEGKVLIKRVAGVPGDKINAEGQLVSSDMDAQTIVEKNQYYVLGDNSDNSYDSRYFGCINANKVIGKVFVRLFPNPTMHF